MRATATCDDMGVDGRRETRVRAEPRRDRVFEVHLSGEVTARDVGLALRGVRLVEHPLRTVVRVRLRDQAALGRLLRRVRGFGLEVVGLRNVSAGLYEQTLAGGVGPVLRNALTPCTLGPSRVCTVVHTVVPAERDLVDVVADLDARGLVIEEAFEALIRRG